MNNIKDYIIFDLETTGLSCDRDYIIEIGAIKYIDDKEVDVFSYLIKPDVEISEQITKINGISNEMVSESEKIEEIIPKFIEFIGNNVLVAHNANFDIGFISQWCKKLKIKYKNDRIIDTVPLARRVFKDVVNVKLTTLKERLRTRL